jgi:hypothetical protein
MKGAGKVHFFDQDPSSDSQDLNVYETGELKEYFESVVKMKLQEHQASNGSEDASISN